MHKFIFKSSILTSLLMLTLLVTGCELAPLANVITPQGTAISIEVALTPEQQAQGLMFRKTLAENSGMLFVFEKERMLSFWMKNTLIPLDVAYLNSEGTIVDIQTMLPCPENELQCPSYPAKEKAMYALEINAGEAEKLGLKTGDQLKLHISNYEQSSIE